MDEVGGAFRSSPKMEPLKKKKGRGPRGIKTTPSPKAPQRFWFDLGFLSGQQFSEAPEYWDPMADLRHPLLTISEWSLILFSLRSFWYPPSGTW